jgi:hypothetical protein
LYAAPKKSFRKGLMASSAKGMFAAFTHQYLNGLGMDAHVTPKDDYIWQAWEMAHKQHHLVSRYQRRSGGEGANMQMLNVEELATLFHFPASDARTPVLSNVTARRGEAPDVLQYAKAGESDLPNWKMAIEEARQEERAMHLPEPSLVLPTPIAPTQHHHDAVVPSQSEDDVPPNLPV